MSGNLDDERNLVTRSEIARRYGVTRQAVHLWFKAEDAPQPIKQSPLVALWWWDTVKAWRSDHQN